MNRVLVSVYLTALLAALTAGCATNQPGKFDQYGYLNTRYNYRVVKAGNSILAGDWLLDNYYQSGKSLEPKQVDDYTITYELDVNGDGATDRTEKAFLYDLRFKHKTHDAYIWLRAFPISTDLRDKDLRVLVQRYFDAIAGAGYEAVKLGSSVTVAERRFAPQLLERGSARLAGHDAYMATFDVANVDEVTVSPNARKRRVQVVVIRPPFEHRDNRANVVFPVLMLAGYANLPEDFERDKPSFISLLGRIQIGSQLGFGNVQVEKVSSPTVTSAAVARPSNAEAAPPSSSSAGTAQPISPPAPPTTTVLEPK